VSTNPELRSRLLGLMLCLSVGLILTLRAGADDQTDALVDEIMQLSGARAQVLESLIANSQQGMAASIAESGMPPRAGQILAEEISIFMGEIVDDPRVWAGARTAYASTFTRDELMELRDFYRSELGPKLVHSLPQIKESLTRQMVPILREYTRGNTILQRAVPRLLEEGLINELQARQMLAGSGG
jgi:hypothetical protein